MALIKFGGGVSGASGKVAGTVYARNRSGAYQRNWAKPTNPTTPSQSAARAKLANASGGWQSLNASQVDAWNAYASGMTRLNRMGDSYVPTGRQIYTECYINMQLVGQAPLSSPGPTAVSPSLVGPYINTAAATANFFTDLTPGATSLIIPSGQDPVDCFCVVYGAPAHSAQKNNVNKQRRVVIIEDGSEIQAPTDIHGAFNAYFGATSQDGMVVDLWIKFIDTLTGLSSPIAKVSKVIT